jgi:hypothetical protein
MAGNGKDMTQEEVSQALVHAEPLTDQTALMTFESEAELLEQGFETEIFHKIVEGDMIYGLFVGRGPDIELKQADPKTGKPVIIPSWKIRGLGRDGKEVGVVMQVPGKYEINKFLRSHTPGNTLVGIKFLGRVQVGMNQVTKFATMFKVDPNRAATGPSEIEYENKLKAEADAKARAEAAAK